MSDTDNNDASKLNETPTFEEVTPTLLEMINGPDDENARLAMIELRRMAQLADRMKDFVPALNMAVEALRIAEEDFHRESTNPNKVILIAIAQAEAALSGKPVAQPEKSNIITL